MQESHKDLLDYAMKNNDSNEVATLINLKDNTRLDFIHGKSDRVSIYADANAFHWLRSPDYSELALIHNHL